MRNDLAAKILTVAMTAGALGGCAAPKYQYRPIQLNAQPASSFRQAAAICSSRAQLAGQQAAVEAAASSRGSRQPSSSGFKCSSRAYLGTVRTECNPDSDTDGIAAGFGALADSVAGESARRQASTTVVRGCLAEYGWGVQRRCVENCR